MSSALAWNSTLFGGDRAGTLATMDNPVPATAAAETDSQEVELKALITQIREGNQQALAKLYDLTVSRIYGLALRIAGRADAAEEVAKDVFLQIWRSARLQPRTGQGDRMDAHYLPQPRHRSFAPARCRHLLRTPGGPGPSSGRRRPARSALSGTAQFPAPRSHCPASTPGPSVAVARLFPWAHS